MSIFRREILLGGYFFQECRSDATLVLGVQECRSNATLRSVDECAACMGASLEGRSYF